jgi:ATP-dependent Clp protease adaptor protein ClpS
MQVYCDLKDDTEKLEQNKGLAKDMLQIILYNDDVNTFEHVTQTLIQVCNHSPIQAEQCTFLVHYTGKCAVKSGSALKLKPICMELLDKGLTAKIE